MYPFERFSEDAKKVLTLAQEEAERSKHAYIGTEHVVLGLVREDGLGGQTLRSFGLTQESLRRQIDRVVGRGEPSIIKQIIPTSRVKKVIEIAFEEARRDGRAYVGTEHLLLAVLIEGEGVAAHVLVDLGVSVDKVRQEVEKLRSAGATEQTSPGAPGHPWRRVLFGVKDELGRPIEIELSLPKDYTEEEIQAVMARLKGSFPPPRRPPP